MKHIKEKSLKEQKFHMGGGLKFYKMKTMTFTIKDGFKAIISMD